MKRSISWPTGQEFTSYSKGSLERQKGEPR